MRIKRLNENIRGLTNLDLDDILDNRPVYYPVFKLIRDFTEFYTGNNILVKKGTEVYYNNDRYYEFEVLVPDVFTTELDPDCLEFIEYRSKKLIDEQLEMFKDSNKFNL